MGLLVLLALAVGLLVVGQAVAIVWTLAYPPRRTLGAALAYGEPTSPEEAGLRGEAITLPDATGGEAPAFEVVGERAGDPEAPVVVLVHGFGESRFTALGRAWRYVPHAAAVYAYDLRGHGDHPASRFDGGLREADDLAAVVEFLCAGHGRVADGDTARPVVMVGFSAGAGIALSAAAGMVEAAGKDGGAGRRSDRGTFRGSFRGTLRGLVLEGVYRRWDTPLHRVFEARRYPRYPAIPLAGVLLRLFHPRFGGFDRLVHARQLASWSRCPMVTFLHGREDALCPIDEARELADSLPPERVRWVALTGGHFDLAEAEPQRYGAAIAEAMTRSSA